MSETNKPAVLVVDDDPGGGAALAEALAALPVTVTRAESGDAAMRALDATEFALVITDLVLPGIDGMEVLRRAQQLWPDTEVIVVTGYGSIERAVAAMSAGAFTFLTKPLNLQQVRLLARRALGQRDLQRDNRRLRTELGERTGAQGIVGQSAAIVRVREMVRQLGPVEATVLLLGESGTGKEVVARALHAASARQERLFLPVNCAAISPSLLESELFGHEKGAFTGAVKERPGFLEMANGGTLFLDEIGELPLDLQAKLLRVLDEQTFYRVGGSQPVRVNIRLIAATNRDLEQAVREQRFREDLFYRLNVVQIQLTPLRERQDDIPLLVEHFLGQLARQYQRPAPGLTPAALQVLQNYAWPGNVRELRNCIESMLALSRAATLDADAIPARVRLAAPTPAAAPVAGDWRGRTLAELERMAIEQALADHRHNRRAAAKQLGVPERTFYRKLKEYALA
ncbi:MAG TPA: sigma-54 dependent transcriptional regulator [bacterium]|nr:sigma-54 dependent transcriptional regulator [bacterium]